MIFDNNANTLTDNFEIKDFRSGDYLPSINLQYIDNEGGMINFKK